MKQVLIVDDEKSLLQSLETGLEAYSDKFKVLTAENGRAALEVIRMHMIDLVVTDLKMPVMDGFGLLAVLAADFPAIQAMVMTAFGTPETDEKVRRYGTFTILEKPIDFDELAATICTKLEKEQREGTISGISLGGFLQLIEMEQKTCLLEIYAEENNRGYLFLRKGQPYDAIYEGVKSEEAVYRMLALEEVRINFKAVPAKSIKKRIQGDVATLMLNGTKYSDEDGKLPEEIDHLEAEFDLPGMDSLATVLTEEELKPDPNTLEVDEPTGSHKSRPEEGDGEIEGTIDILQKMTAVDGFLAVGVFSPRGEMVKQINKGGIEIGEVGALANVVLLKAQKVIDRMEAGRALQVHIEAPDFHVIACCLNESTEPEPTSSGQAHLHMVLILETEGNLTMGKMKLQSIIHELAPLFR